MMIMTLHAEPLSISHADVVKPTKFCRECGAEIPRESKYCEKCGVRLV